MNSTAFKLGLGIGFGMPEIPDADRIKIIAESGFDSVFTGYGGTRKLEALANEIVGNGPFGDNGFIPVLCCTVSYILLLAGIFFRIKTLKH